MIEDDDEKFKKLLSDAHLRKEHRFYEGSRFIVALYDMVHLIMEHTQWHCYVQTCEYCTANPVDWSKYSPSCDRCSPSYSELFKICTQIFYLINELLIGPNLANHKLLTLY